MLGIGVVQNEVVELFLHRGPYGYPCRLPGSWVMKLSGGRCGSLLLLPSYQGIDYVMRYSPAEVVPSPYTDRPW